MSTPRSSQKKQATLTSFFTPKSSGSVPASQPNSQPRPSPSQPSQSLPSRKRPLQEEADRNKGGKDNKGKTSSAAAAKRSRQKPIEKENDDDGGGDDDDDDDVAKESARSRFSRAVKRARTVVEDEDEEEEEESDAGDKDFAPEDVPAPEPESASPPPPPPPPSQLRSSGRTDRYIYAEQTYANKDEPPSQHSRRSGRDDSESESDDPETKRRKEELHRKFVKKLGHPDSLLNMRRRNFVDGTVSLADNSGDGGGDGEGAEEDEEEEEQQPAPTKKGAGSKKKGKLTPMELQFLSIKRKHLDTLLVVEVGYKFKFLGEDARTAARVLGIVCIPGKLRYDEHASEAHLDRFASASIPVPRLPVHVKRLVAAGHKVGVVRQMETAALKKAGDNRNAPFVRQLTNIYTKGTYIEEEELGSTGSKDGATSAAAAPSSSSGYLLCLTESPAAGTGAGTDEKVQVGMLAVQPATGDIIYDSFEDGFMRNEIETRLLHIAPCELLLVGGGHKKNKEKDEEHLLLSKATEKLVQHISGSATNVFGDRTRVERVARTPPSDAYTHVTAFYSGKLPSDAAGSTANNLLDTVLHLPENVTVCLSAMITHLTEYGLQHIFELTKYFSSFTTRQHMLLNGTTLESLEVYRNATDHGLRGSLLWALDKTHTRFGHRLLRKWIGRPLLDRAALEARVDAVQELLEAAGSARRDKLEQLLSGGAGAGAGKTDLERSLIRIYYGKCTRAELVAVLQTLQRISSSYAGMPGTPSHPSSTGFASPLLVDCIRAIPATHKTVVAYLDTINADAARTNDKYQFFRDAHETDDITNYKVGIAAVEAELDAHRADIAKTLGKAAKPSYVTVAGIEYLVEVTNGAGGDLKRVPASWIKVSGTKRVSRFHTPTVVRLLSERDQHKESLAAACDAAFRALLADIASHYQPLRDTVAALATLDCLLSLAKVAALPGYTRPTLLTTDNPETPGILDIQGGRHPVAEHTLPSAYIPFSTRMGGAHGPLALLVTGPNMGGKSSFVRAVALLTLLAQIGSYVPADAMRLTLADAIYTRMGARDNLFAGESTFMVEVSETAAILRAATPRSLVVLDELGRGTSTHDGAAIAQAVLEHVARDTRCLTLFITHYQSLGRAAAFSSSNTNADADADADADSQAPRIQNVHMAFREDKDTDEITFLYEVAPGMAHRSYGLNVARLANIPQRVLAVAAQKSREMEMDVQRRRLQAAIRLAGEVLNPKSDQSTAATAGVDQLEYLKSSIEQL